MQYRYYILRLFLAFTLIVGVRGVWGQTHTIETININLLQTALKEYANDIENINSVQSNNVQSNQTGGHIWSGSCSVKKKNNNFPIDIFFVLEYTKDMNLISAFSFEHSFDGISLSNNDLAHIDKVVKTKQGYLMPIRIPGRFKFNKDVTVFPKNTFGKLSKVIDAYIETQINNTKAAILNTSLPNSDYTIEGELFVSLDNQGDPLSCTRFPMNHFESFKVSFGYSKTFVAEPNSFGKNSIFSFYSKLIDTDWKNFNRDREDYLRVIEDINNPESFVDIKLEESITSKLFYQYSLLSIFDVINQGNGVYFIQMDRSIGIEYSFQTKTLKIIDDRMPKNRFDANGYYIRSFENSSVLLEIQKLDKSANLPLLKKVTITNASVSFNSYCNFISQIGLNKYRLFYVSKTGYTNQLIFDDNLTILSDDIIVNKPINQLTNNKESIFFVVNDNDWIISQGFVYLKKNNSVSLITPAFSFTPTAPQVNQSVTFKDESTGSPTSWAWDFGDGTTSTQQNPTKTYTKAGTYTVKLTISKQGVTATNTTKSITIAAETATLTLSATTRNAPVAGEQGGLNISTNINWTASSNAAWLKVSPVSGNAGTNIPINYSVEANTATTARTGIITFTAGTQIATFTVTQAGVAPSLSVSPTAPATIASSGSTVALSVVSNLSWAVTKSANSDWLTVSPASGTGNQNVSVTASANAATAERSATLTFSAAGVANIVVTIRQAGVNASLSLSETSIKVNASPISIGILKLTTNTAWAVSSDAEWLTIGPASGNAGTNIELTWSVAINNSVSSRTGKITVMAGTQTATFTVTQAGINPEFSLSAESKTVVATGESGQLGITSNVPWSATSNATWLTFSPASGGVGVINNFRYSVEANPNTTTRTGIITFSAGGLAKTFTVTQEGTKPTPPQAPTQLTVTVTSEYELRISWKDNANNETSYELERADGPLPTNSDFKKIATLPANTTAVLDQKLTSKSRYCYRVRAVNAVGASELSETVCGTTNAPPAGITLMVHGFNPSDDADFKENFAVIAQAIKERAGAGATVYTNDPKKGTWRKWELVENNGNGDPTKEIILFYNWAVASNNELLRLENLRNNLRYMSNSGYLEGSADILFAMLADAQIPNLPNNLLTSGKPLHFIGHSRGNVLLSQLMHRMAKWFPNVKIDHYTALDPHPATTMGDVVRQQENTYSSLPLISGIASNCTATIGCSSASSGFDEIKIRIPENVAKAEVYYRKDGNYEDADKVLENILQAYLATPFSLPAVAWHLYTNRYDKLVSAFDGVPSIGGVNHQLDNAKISMGNTGGLGGAHSGVVSWYFGTIDTRVTTEDGKPISYDGEPLYLNAWYGTNGALMASKPAREKSGYYFSRIGGGYAQLADATEKINLAEMNRQLSIRPREGNADGGMKLGVQNGNFEYNNDSGWKYGGGNIASNNQTKNGQVIVSGSGLSIKSEINITHSLMYYPANFSYVMAQIKFDTKQTGTKFFSVQFLNRDLTAIDQAIEVVPTKNDTKVFIKIPASLKGKSGSFTIKATGVLLEKVEFSDRAISQDLIVESLSQPEMPQTTEALYEIFPNPNNGRFSLMSQDAQVSAISLVVVDVMGNVIFKATDNQLSVFNAQQKLDIVLPGGFTGTYTLRIETAQGVSVKRIIKE